MENTVLIHQPNNVNVNTSYYNNHTIFLHDPLHCELGFVFLWEISEMFLSLSKCLSLKKEKWVWPEASGQTGKVSTPTPCSCFPAVPLVGSAPPAPLSLSATGLAPEIQNRRKIFMQTLKERKKMRIIFTIEQEWEILKCTATDPMWTAKWSSYWVCCKWRNWTLHYWIQTSFFFFF